MAQVKFLKVGSLGLPQQAESSDDITLQSYTANSGGSFSVTSGVTIDSNISFNAVTDTIAGIQNQNLLDKTATESISGAYTFNTVAPTSTVAPTLDDHLVRKQDLDNVVNGIDWQESVLDIQVDATLDPGASPATGARYILTDTGALNANFGTITGVGDGDIVEYDGANFIVVYDVSVNTEGGSTWVENINRIYRYNGTAWVDGGATTDHNTLNGLQGGNGSTEYYHMTAAEDTFLNATVTKITAGGDVVANNVDDTLTANYTVTGEIDVAGGDLVLPNSTQAVPEEGSAYWNGTDDTLNIYDGTKYVAFSADGDTTTYTVGAGGVTAGDAVYVSANDTVLKADASAIATGKLIGFAKTTESAASTVEVQHDGTIANITASAGDIIYLDTTAGALTTTPPTGAGEVVYKAGFAKNATTLDIQLQFIAIR